MEKINKQTDGIQEHDVNEKEVRENAKKAALEKVKQKVAIVNVNEIAEAEARKAADNAMSKSSKEKMNIFKKIWKNTFAEQYYRSKEINRVRKEIEGGDNIYAGRINNDKSFHESAMKSISERFISDYDGTLSEGEEKKILDDKEKGSEETRNSIKDLIIKYAEGSLTEEAFASEKVRVLNNLKNEDLLKGSKNYADNLLEIAKNAKLAIEHGAKIEELELDTNIIIGKAKSSLKTEAHFNTVDKIVDKLKNSPAGRFVNPATMSLAVGIAYSASVGIGKKVMNSNLTKWGTFGASVAATTLLMGANESHRVTEERKQHGLEMAEGGTFEEGDKRREQMNKYQYAMENSTDLESNLRNMMFEKDANGNEVPKDLKQEDIDNILSNLANIEARTSLNSKNKIDLISYSNIGNVEKERTDLTILVAQTKVSLRKKIEGELAGNFDGKKFDELLNEKSKVIEDALLGGEAGIDAKDKAFSKYKTKRVASKMVATAISGLVVGATVQEVVSWFNGNVQGNIEAILGKNNNAAIQTPLEHLRGWMTGNSSHIGMEGALPFNINGHELRLSDGSNIIPNGDGTFNILRGENVVSDHIKLGFDSSGALDHETVARLGQDGIMATSMCEAVNTPQSVQSTAEEYLKNHPGSGKHISHDGWYDNGTPKPVFDKNELELKWQGTGVDSNGNYVLSIDQMKNNGSFNINFSGNEFDAEFFPAKAAYENGQLSIMMSLTQGTQNYAFEVPIDANGHAIIDPNSEVGKLFFDNQNGHAVFKGRFAEVVQSFGEKNGSEHVKTLATLVGQGNDSIPDVLPIPTDETINLLDFSKDTEMPYFIPIVGRTPLEQISHKEKDLKKKNEDKKGEPIIIQDGGEKIEKQKTLNEISREEYDAMYDDLKMINRKIQISEGIITLSRDDFKSEYGKKRYIDLKSIPDGVPVRFNKTELQTIGDELEGLLSKSKVVSKEDEAKRLAKEKADKLAEKNMKDDLKMLNKAISQSKGIIDLKEENFKSEYGLNKYKELKHIKEEVPTRYNKDELEEIAKGLENLLSGSKTKTENFSINEYGEITRPNKKEAEKEKMENLKSEIVEKFSKQEENKSYEIGKDGQAIFKNNKDSTETISDEEFKKYVDNNDVNEKTLNSIAEKQKNGDKLTTRESAIFQNNIPKVEKILSQFKSNEEKKFNIKDLEKIGTEFESKEGTKFTITKFVKPWFSATRVEVIMKDKTGKENLVSYKLKDLQNEFTKGNIKIVKIEEGK